jgi:hypothetical protein
MSEERTAPDSGCPEDEKIARLEQRLEKLRALEAEIKAREKALKEKERGRKQLLLRLSPTLWEELAAWAEADFRSVNGQIEFLLSECVRRRKGKD